MALVVVEVVVEVVVLVVIDVLGRRLVVDVDVVL